MKLATLEQLHESLEGLDNSSPDSLNKLVGDMFKAFDDLQSQIESNSPMEREQALHIALGLKAALDKQAALIRKSMDEENTLTSRQKAV